MSRDDWSVGIFSLVGMGVAALCAYQSGKKNGYKEYEGHSRDRELDELRKQVAELKLTQQKEIN